jgi:hypothetical protein
MNYANEIPFGAQLWLRLIPGDGWTNEHRIKAIFGPSVALNNRHYDEL